MIKISKVIETLMETKSVLGDIDIDFPKTVKKTKEFSLIEEVRKFTDYNVSCVTLIKTSIFPRYSVKIIDKSIYSNKSLYSITLFFKSPSSNTLSFNEDINKVFKGLEQNSKISISTKIKKSFIVGKQYSYSFEVYA